MNLYFWIPLGILLIVFIVALYKRYQMLKDIKDVPPSENMIILTDANFKRKISKGISLVDFWADWCTPCKIQAPIINELAEKDGDKYNICKFEVDKNRKIATEYGIKNIPTTMIFKDGKPFKKLVGVKTYSVLLKALSSAE